MQTKERIPHWENRLPWRGQRRRSIRSERDSPKDSIEEFRAKLRNPCLLNLVCGLFALQRLYQCLGFSWMQYLWGHVVVVGCYMVGFLFGLVSGNLNAFNPKADAPISKADTLNAKFAARITKSAARIAKAVAPIPEIAAFWSYFFLITASLGLLVAVLCDVLKKPH
jgi:hypothetical protein